VNFINAVILLDKANKEFIVAFSGTKNPAQLGNEILNNPNVDYDMHDIEGSRVLKYFYNHYQAFSDWIEDEVREAAKKNYKVVFTGHSLGGALAVHAATDMYLEKLRTGS